MTQIQVVKCQVQALVSSHPGLVCSHRESNRIVFLKLLCSSGYSTLKNTLYVLKSDLAGKKSHSVALMDVSN